MIRTLIILFILVTGCSTKQHQKLLTSNKFNIPVIIQRGNIDTVKAFEAECMQGVYPKLIGKFKFGDTINFSGLPQQAISEKEYLWEVQNILNSDSLSSDGLQIIPDYNTSVVFSDFGPVKHLYFPVYIVNETYEPKIFFGKDRHGFAIQEAIDTSDYDLWHPIESAGYDFCGNGWFRKKLNPKEFLLFLLPKYSGSETTSLRIRFRIGQNTFILKSFPGIINRKQFDIDKKDWMYSYLKETKGGASGHLFYGGQPKGF